jgi:hypothetical protein
MLCAYIKPGSSGYIFATTTILKLVNDCQDSQDFRQWNDPVTS